MERQPISCLFILMTLPVHFCFSESPAVIETTSLTRYEGTCVEIICQVTGHLPNEDALWFWMKDGIWHGIDDYSGTIVYSNKPAEYPISPQFRHRVNYTGSSQLASTYSTHRSCSVSICHLTLQDSGEYFFRYIPTNPDHKKNKWRTRKNASLKVQKYPCTITFNKPEPVQENTEITLTCQRSPSCPDVDIKSVLPSYLRASSYYRGKPATLKYRPKREDDGREFICETRGNTDKQQQKIRISVQYTPRNTHIETLTQIREVAVGSSMTFKCNSDANPAPYSYFWYRTKSQRYFQKTSENSLELIVKRADEGCYTCSVTNTVGSDYSSTHLCIHIHILFPPTSLTLSLNAEVTEGQSVSITCGVDSSPVSTLTLSRTSQGSTEELHKVTENNFLDYSMTVSSTHSGEYTCFAQNSVGSNSTKRSLKVKYSPQNVRVQADPGLTVKENTTLRLLCSAQSHPPVSSVTWSRGPTGQGPTVYRGSTFIVPSVSVNDQGLYSCTAHNQVGRRTSPPAEVIVTFGPKQAVVLRAEEEQGPDGSRSVTLSCSSHSVPVSRYTWYRRTEDRAVKVSQNINYTVPSTKPGVYYCTAKNDISESTSEPVALFLQRGFGKYIFLALVPLLIILCAFLVYRLKRKRPVEEERANKSWWRSCSRTVGQWQNRTDDVHAEAPRRRDVPGPQQRADMTNGTSDANALYSTVDHLKDKQDRAATSDPHTRADSLFYATIHFEKTKPSVLPGEREDVVYSTVKKHEGHEEAGDVYENITDVKKSNCSNASDSSEDEVDVSYSMVNFRSKARSRGETQEEEYSELNF